MLFDKSNPDKRDKCVNEIAFYQKAISNLLRLVSGDLKTRPSGSNSLNRLSSASPGFILKNHLNDRSKEFMLLIKLFLFQPPF